MSSRAMASMCFKSPPVNIQSHLNAQAPRIESPRNFFLRASSPASSSHQHNDGVNQGGTAAVAIRRREMSALGGALFLWMTDAPTGAETGTTGVFSRYIKRKKLDPLDTYIPPVILCQSQFQDLEAKLLSGNPDYNDSRLYLRAGPASSLRINIRAVAQYASESGDGKTAFEAVDQCIGSLEDLDSLLLRASRNDASATVQKMKDKIDVAMSSIDRLLATVPSPVLEKCKAIVASYKERSTDPETQQMDDADVKFLESLL